MPRTVSIGEQDFEELITRNNFYVDKTKFIKEWWESDDKVTLITRPRRFGKTLNMSMLERFFSVEYAGQGGVFENLEIWKDEKYRELQGTWPVIFLSFAGVKADNYVDAKEEIFLIIAELFRQHNYLKKSEILEEKDKKFFDGVGKDMDNSDAVRAIHQLAEYLYRHYGKKVIILLDEYDTPLQEAYVNGYWGELVSFIRSLFNNTFKTNPYLGRAVMTGVTNIVGMKFAAQTSNGSALAETMFSDLNNLTVVTITSNKYADCFGFTEEEVFHAMDEFGMTNKDEVKQWYDGFMIGNLQDIYNPWSITNFLDEGCLKPYWANTSSNGLVSQLIREGNRDIKMQFELLLSGRTIRSRIDEEMVFNQLDGNECAVWSLLLTSGYLKIIKNCGREYELSLTNYEVKLTFENMVRDWFGVNASDYNAFIRSLLKGNRKEMNAYMNRVALCMFSSFDGGTHPSGFSMPEKFYHGFVLGLLVDLADRYEVTSNRESGYGRYDVLLSPKLPGDDGIILEFKVYDPDEESSLQETVNAALTQIEEKKYEQTLLARGISKENIRKYGFAFRGKEVLIGSSL